MKDEEIDKLIKSKKEVQKIGKEYDKGWHTQRTFKLRDDFDNQYHLYMRQHKNKKMIDNFSCGLSLLQDDGSHFTLTRYNGSSHNHANELESRKLGYVCHIHKATQKYIEAGKKADGYAEATDRYNNLAGAFTCLCKDCNINHNFGKNIFGNYEFR